MKRFIRLLCLIMIFVLILPYMVIGGFSNSFASTLYAPSEFKANVFQYYNELSWKDSNPSYYYTVIEKSIDQGTFNPIVTLYKGTTTYRDYSISNGHVYTYRAKSYYGSDTSQYTNEAEAITLYPTNFKIVRALHNQVDLEWTYPALPILRSNDYETLIERRLANVSTWSAIATLPESETTYNDTAVDTDSLYYYRIRTRYTNGSYSYYYPSDYGISTRTAYPLTTPLWGYAVSDNQIKLEWDMSKINGGTVVLQKRDIAGNFTTLFTSTYANSYTDYGATKGSTYTYRLYLQSKNGMNSEFTEEIDVKAETVPLPTDLTANAVSADKITLFWSYPYDVETGFEIWRKSTDSCEKLAVLPKNSETYTDAGAASGKSYTYMVRALRGETAFSGFSQHASVINEYPAVPGSLVYYTNGTLLYIYSAENAPSNTIYTLEYRDGINSEWMDFSSVNTGTLIAHVSFSSSSEYFFRLRANIGGLESYSPEYHFIGSRPDPVQNFNAPLVGYTRILLTWDDVSTKEEGYHIYRTINGKKELIGNVGKDKESFTDTTPVKGSVSRYEVVSYNVIGESAIKAVTVRVPSIVAYKDISLTHWVHDAAYTLQGLGAFEGANNGYFNPQNTLNLGQTVRILLRSFNIPYEPQGILTFADLPPKHTYYKDIVTAVRLGLIFPDTQGRIYPDKAVTRRDLAHMLNNTLNYLDKPLFNYDTEILNSYSDYETVTMDEAPIIASLTGDGIITGKSGNRLSLSTVSTKAEIAAIVFRTLLRYGIGF